MKKENQQLVLSVIAATVAVVTFGLLLSFAPDWVRSPISTPTPGGVEIGTYRQVDGFSLIDQDGQPRTLADFQGKPVLMSLGFTNCPDVCPLTLADFKKVKTALGAQGDQVAFVMVSVDPARDTPEQLKRYLSIFDDRFIGLTGDEKAIRAWTQQLDASYKKIEPEPGQTGYTVGHTSFMYLFDREGVWRLQYPYQTPAEVMAGDIQALLP
jgi:protein SCO1